jgi:eukaryotic-like serine/threonine-protein kinase
MKPERSQQIDEIFQAALDLPTDQRAAYLDQACAGDDELRDEVESLISSYEQAGSFIEQPAIEVDASVVAGPLTSAMAGASIGHYQIIEPLGSGGMGEVYLALDTRMDRKVALKLLPQYFTEDQERVRRFQQEARAVLALNHPNIVTIYEVGQADDKHFIATEFIEGETLRQRMSHGPWKLGESIDIASQVAGGLTAAHEAGIIHRDIKPENVMLRRDGYAKVLDFGLAKLTERPAITADTEAPTRVNVKTDPGIVMGTANYMSPEQARGLKVDGRTDIWSLGVVLYEMITGRVPFAGETPSDVIVSTLEKEAPPLARYSTEVPAELQRIVDKALRKSREERYQTVKDLYLDLRNLKQEREVDARLERSLQSHADGREAATANVGQAAAAAVGRESTARTAGVGVAYPTSSAEYLISVIRRHRRGVVLGLVTIVLAAALLSYFWIVRNSERTETSAAVRSIAVLPFKPLGSDANDAVLGFGMADTLITRLSSLRQIIVRPTGAVSKYTGASQDPVAAGRELNVDAVLEASIQRSGDRVRVTLRLVRVSDGLSLWTQTVDEQVNDTFAVQDRVAEQVARALVPQLTGNEKDLVAKHYTQNPDAYRLYMNGRYLWNKGTVEDWRKAIEYFNLAIEKDPNYALAYTGLADAYLSMVADSLMPKAEAIPKAKQAAMMAFRLDDTLAEGHVSLGRIKAYYDWDWSGAELEFKRAVELDPNSSIAHREYGCYLAAVGRSDQAIAEAKQGRDLDPLSQQANFYVAWTLISAHRHDEAIEQSRQVLETFPVGHFWIGMAYLGKSRYEEAIAEFEKTLSRSRDHITAKASLGYAYGMSGKRAQAEKVLADLEELFKQRKGSPYNIAMIYAGLGKKDQAFAWLEQAYLDHSRPLATGLKVSPTWDKLRSDARFADLLRRMGLG